MTTGNYWSLIDLIDETVINRSILMIPSFVPTDIQNPHVSVKEEAATVQERRSSHEEDEAESQFTDVMLLFIT